MNDTSLDLADRLIDMWVDAARETLLRHPDYCDSTPATVAHMMAMVRANLRAMPHRDLLILSKRHLLTSTTVH